MIVEIDKDGILHIEASTELDSYALKRWCEHNKIECDYMIIDTRTQAERLPAGIVYSAPKEKED